MFILILARSSRFNISSSNRSQKYNSNVRSTSKRRTSPISYTLTHILTFPLPMIRQPTIDGHLGRLPNAIIQCHDGTTFPVHRYILESRCPSLALRLDDDDVDTEGKTTPTVVCAHSRCRCLKYLLTIVLVACVATRRLFRNDHIETIEIFIFGGLHNQPGNGTVRIPKLPIRRVTFEGRPHGIASYQGRRE